MLSPRVRASMARFFFQFVSSLVVSMSAISTADAQAVEKYIVMRVDFQDSTTAPRYTRQEVEQQLANVTDLFTENSNKSVQVEFTVTDLFRLPKNAADYSSASMEVTIQDALANAPSAVTALWSNGVHAIMVLLSKKWDRGASYYATRNVGQSGSAIFVGNAVVGE